MSNRQQPNPLRGTPTEIELERFWSKVLKLPESEGNCWLWEAATVKGYGKFKWRDRVVMAHRLAWYFIKGVNPKDETLDHLCRNRNCVNPDHLEEVSAVENTFRRPLPDVCANDHPYTEENTYYHPSGGRRCYECAREYDRKRAKKRYEKEKELATHSSKMEDFASNPKLNHTKVKEIRTLYSEGWSQRKLARKYKVSQPNIGYITRNESWTDDKWDPKNKTYRDSRKDD